MKFTAALLSMAPFLGLAVAIPTPAEVAPRCGTTYYPSILQQLTEANPSSVSVNSNTFSVQQTVTGGGSAFDRVYQLVAFTDIAPGSYACQLALTFPPGYAITTTPSSWGPQMNVTTVLNGSPDSIVFPNNFSWDALPSLSLGQGLFGTVSAVPGETAVINSETCDTALAFLFEIAVWESVTAAVSFDQSQSPLAGVYLTANC